MADCWIISYIGDGLCASCDIPADCEKYLIATLNLTEGKYRITIEKNGTHLPVGLEPREGLLEIYEKLRHKKPEGK